MTIRILAPAKGPTETVPVTFDFTKLLLGATVNTKAVTATTWRGTDASPSAIISGAATELAGVVTQMITAGIDGVDYKLTCSCLLSDGRTVAVAAILPVRVP